MAVEGTDAKKPSAADKVESGHVMVSYEWSHQKTTLTRLVKLQLGKFANKVTMEDTTTYLKTTSM